MTTASSSTSARVPAGRIANPSETSLHPFSVHETLGPCTVEGRIGGRRIGFRTEGIVEFAGGAHD
ncbi:hypothetical protein LT493_36225 [Streptomyces tricolor]|nr:hypothetical protein [Streptomyces tricolor]